MKEGEIKMYIIQTNRTMTDFQSYIYEVKEKTWEEFKEYIQSEYSIRNKYFNELNKVWAMKPRDDNYAYIERINVNDDRHFEVIFNGGTSGSYMKVDDRMVEGLTYGK
jgi:hypothetical protein